MQQVNTPVNTPLPKSYLFALNQKNFMKYNFSFVLKFKMKENEILLQISKNLNQVYWEKYVSKELLISENKNWSCFDDEQDILNFIFDEIDSPDTEFEVDDKSLNVTLKLKILKGKRESIYNLVLNLETKKSDSEFTLQQVSDNVTSINYEISQIKDKINLNSNSLEEMAKQYQDLFVKCEGIIEKCILNDEKVANLSNELSKTNKELNTAFQELSFIKQNLIKQPHNYKISTSFVKLNDDNFSFTNGNKTVQKIAGDPGWFDIFCIDKVKYEDIQEFTIRIDNINKSSILMFGFALYGSSNLSGLLATNTSWMCYLKNGKFYNAGDESKNFCYGDMLKPSNGDIISLCLDTQLDLLYVKLNGKVCSTSRKMDIDEKQKMSLYPCVDLYSVNDQVTIV